MFSATDLIVLQVSQVLFLSSIFFSVEFELKIGVSPVFDRSLCRVLPQLFFVFCFWLLNLCAENWGFFCLVVRLCGFLLLQLDSDFGL